MNIQDKIFKLEGKVQHYEWGGFDFIPAWLGIENDAHKPFAEYWMGAHPSASSNIVLNEKKYSLYEMIKENADHFLNKKIAAHFGMLPYLFKILDVHDMLSIQVHPSKSDAVKGFQREEDKGVHITAPQRNYKDKNHKPEMMVALSEFYLLHGFKQKHELKKILQDIKAFHSFIKIFDGENYKALYEHVMRLDQHAVDALLLPLIKEEIEAKRKNILSKNDAGWWVAKLFEGKEVKDNFDRGIFSIYFFNIVHVHKGEGVFQDAGVPHAYLEGQNMELMASSDNVLRAGLTNKHIDINELLKHVKFEGIKPEIIRPVFLQGHENIYPSAAEDFDLSIIALKNDEIYDHVSSSFETFCVMEGSLKLSGSNGLSVAKGEVFAILPNEHYKISTTETCVVYKAFVPS